jgi:hypothetical protein
MIVDDQQLDLVARHDVVPAAQVSASAHSMAQALGEGNSPFVPCRLVPPC